MSTILQGLRHGLHFGCIALAVSGALVLEFPAHAQKSGSSDAGPVRLARFAYVNGDVSWRRDTGSKWAAAARHLPIRQGAQVAVANGGRAEIQFDDGSRLRLGGNAVATLQTLYSDRDGEFTEITLTEGPAELRLKHERSIYQVNTPTVSLEAKGPARFRVDAGDRTRITMFKGTATINGPQGKTTLAAGNCLDLHDRNAPYHVAGLPHRDSFDGWNDERDRAMDRYATGHAHRSLPPNVALAQDDFDDYGDWRSDRRYGDVWVPRTSRSDWRPYRDGHWVWVDPYGWTWVSDEPWGYAPYHYGTWIREPYGWAWVPGPRYQYWSPGVVAFASYNGFAGWTPLAPAEVIYPSTLSIGFSGGDWSLFFSIGRAAVYYPTSRYAFAPQPWPVDYVNRVTYVNNTTIINNFAPNRNVLATGARFVPINARAGAVMLADSRSFGGTGRYRVASGAQAVNVFNSGRLVAAPPRGQRPAAGPAFVRPTALSTTTARAFRTNVPTSQAALTRPVFRTPLRSEIARTSRPPSHTFQAGAPRITTRPVTPVQGPATAVRAGGTAAERAMHARQVMGMKAGGPTHGAAHVAAKPQPAGAGHVAAKPSGAGRAHVSPPIGAAESAKRARHELGATGAATHAKDGGTTAHSGHVAHHVKSGGTPHPGVESSHPVHHKATSTHHASAHHAVQNNHAGGGAHATTHRSQHATPHETTEPSGPSHRRHTPSESHSGKPHRSEYAPQRNLPPEAGPAGHSRRRMEGAPANQHEGGRRKPGRGGEPPL